MYTTTAAAISLLRIYPADRPTQIAQVQGFFKVRTNLSVHQHEIKACIHTMPHYANFIKKKKKDLNYNYNWLEKCVLGILSKKQNSR